MIGNDTLLGQIATLIETLHLSYEDVVHRIPYRNLLIMQKDRLHACTGEKVKKVSGKEMAARRGKRRKQDGVQG